VLVSRIGRLRCNGVGWAPVPRHPLLTATAAQGEPPAPQSSSTGIKADLATETGEFWVGLIVERNAGPDIRRYGVTAGLVVAVLARWA
jgi:hypothetical protein